MGNRAVLTKDQSFNSPCIYFHWNGGRDSVRAFLKVAKAMGFKNDTPEQWDEFAQFLAKYFFNCEVGRTIYREPYGRADKTSDNGTYIVDENWKIIGRESAPQREQDEYDSDELAHYILARYEGRTPEEAEARAAELVAMGVTLDKSNDLVMH